MKAYFVSDIHIKDPEESNSEKLLLFLRKILDDPEATHLFLVGDIFDLWIENHSFFINRYVNIINVVRDLVSRGVEVHYFEGNHDLYLRKFWQQDVGARVHEGPSYFSLGNYRVRVEHGDFLNPDDHGYLWLRWFLRTPVMKTVAQLLPSPAVTAIGERASKASRHYTSNQKAMEEKAVKKFMRTYAEKAWYENEFDFFVAGHTHVKDQYHFKANDREVIAFNLGSWFEEQQALRIDDSGAHFETL